MTDQAVTKTPPAEVARLMVINWFTWCQKNDLWCEMKSIDPSGRTPYQRYKLTYWPDKKDKRNKTSITFAASEAPAMIRDFAKMASWRMADPNAYDAFDPWEGIVR